MYFGGIPRNRNAGGDAKIDFFQEAKTVTHEIEKQKGVTRKDKEKTVHATVREGKEKTNRKRFPHGRSLP